LRHARLALAAAFCALVAATGLARADDYVTLRGAYYREPSTRVIQPTVEVERDDVVTGLDVKAHFLVDTITSASVAAGTSVDSIFTETRNEAGLSVRGRSGRNDVTLGYKYSAESDYWSHGIGLSLGRRIWGDTGRLGVSLGYNHDEISSRFRTPYCATPPSHSCYMKGYFFGLSYTQILSPVLLAQVSAESLYASGFQANLYRVVPNFDYERLPERRLRNALAARVAYYLPRTKTALRLAYRFYFDLYPCDTGDPQCRDNPDPWHITSHMIEAHVYQTVTRTLDVRLSYRQYLQTNAANFWCDVVASPGCYPASSIYYSTDPKLGRVTTAYPEVKLFWLAEAFTGLPVLDWIATGTFDISYGRFFQSTSFANAHVLQMGYTMPY
jgi:Protein of unknown function (DUF3570)